MFTADAGVEALDDVNTHFGSHTRGALFFQIPHHGSRHNINRRLIEHYKAKTAYVSAVGNDDHPNPHVIREFKRFGNVYGTHHPPPGGSKRWSQGNAPTRPGYSPAVPL